MGAIFGTDGVRGVAGVALSSEFAYKIGRATAQVITARSDDKPKVVLGKDTRISSDMIENAICAGLCAGGVDVVKIGVVPTPAVAYITKEMKADGGVMISASHNSYEYNGIKIFSGDGYKLSDSEEEEIEAIVLGKKIMQEEKTFDSIGVSVYEHKAVHSYSKYLKDCINLYEMPNFKVAIDCSNGSAVSTAREIFEDLKMDCTLLNITPNGININENCGSTHTGLLAEYVKANKCDMGIAFDGDADRFLAVDEDGELIDGDRLMAIIGSYLKSKGMLKSDTIVATVMSNLGFMKFAENADINVPTTKVGDRYVLAHMIENGYNLGGEQSGHIILSDYMTTGDGQLSALMTLKAISETGKSLKELKEVMKVYPQTLLNIKVNEHVKANYHLSHMVNEKIDFHTNQLKGRGRILVRASGTEPLVRVMVEAENEEETQNIANDIASVIKELV